MLLKVYSAAPLGIDSIGVTVEVNVASRGMPYFDIVGLPSKAVDESKQRVKTALLNSDIDFPDKRITVNLAPADLPKEGSFYDLPIATGIMCSVKGIEVPERSLFFGEVSLDGTIRHTKGAFLLALYARESGFESIFVPKASAKEAAAISGISVFPVQNLCELLVHLSGRRKILAESVCHTGDKGAVWDQSYDMRNILGQEQAKRALEIVAAGGHNVIMSGSPGTGKTMLANALHSLLPPLSTEESLEVTKIYSAVGNIPPGGTLIYNRPFRSPHHTISYVGMVGGGSVPKPGEISLSHRGVLFLDEFNEFSRQVMEALRQPMESGAITVSRSYGSYTFPSRFTLVAACNPCPCGYYGHPRKSCICTPRQVENYRKKLSGPILDRIDLFCTVNDVDVEDLTTDEKVLKNLQSSEDIRDRVGRARKIQAERFKSDAIFTNSEMKNDHIRKYCNLEKGAENLLKQAVSKMNLSARAYFRVLKVSRTIADLECSDTVDMNHIGEALQYRMRYDN